MPSGVSSMTVVEIPLEKIRPNPHQPRQVTAQEAIDLMAESLTAIGQQTAAKVRPLTESEKLADPDNLYELIGGHIRYAGALKAGLPTLKCLVLNLTPAQAELSALMDNQSTDMHWLDWVLAIERLYGAMQEKSQDKLGVQLGLSGARINNALKVARVLSPASRLLIVHQVNALGPEKAVSERAIRALADLGDPSAVEKALPAVLEKGMTASQVRQMVKALRGEAATPIRAAKSPETLNSPPLKEGELKGVLASELKPSAPQTSPVTPHKGVLTGVVGSILWGEVKSAAHRLFYRVLPAGGQLPVGQPSAETGAVSARIPRWLGFLLSRYQKLGLKDRVWVGFLTAGLILFLATFLIHQVGRLLTHLFIYQPQTHLSTGPQAGGQALVVPSQGANGNGGTKQDSAYLSAAPYPPMGDPGQAMVAPSQGTDGNGGTKGGPVEPAAGDPSPKVSTGPHKPAGETGALVSVPVAPGPQASVVKKQPGDKAIGGSGNNTQTSTVAAAPTPAPTKPQGQDPLGKALTNAASQGVSAAAGEAIKKILPF